VFAAGGRALTITAAEIAAALQARRTGHRWMAPCPAHKDKSPSLSIQEQNGRVLVHCFSGCRQDDVIAALRQRGLWPERDRNRARQSFLRDPNRAADLARAEYWRAAARILAEDLLEQLPLGDPDRYILTTFANALRDPLPQVLVTAYRDWKSNNPKITAGLVRAGRLHDARVQRRLAKWLIAQEESR
jgi:hypothetical protein